MTSQTIDLLILQYPHSIHYIKINPRQKKGDNKSLPSLDLWHFLCVSIYSFATPKQQHVSAE